MFLGSMVPAARKPGEDDVARAFVSVQSVLDRIRRGELHAGDAERIQLTQALAALRELRPA